MKKFILAAAVVLTIAGSACTKDSGVAPAHKANTLADKANLAQCDLTQTSTPESPCIPPPTDGGVK